MTIEEQIRSWTHHQKLEALEILHRQLAADEPAFDPPAWHAEVLAERRNSPDPAPPLPIKEAFKEIRANFDASHR